MIITKPYKTLVVRNTSAPDTCLWMNCPKSIVPCHGSTSDHRSILFPQINVDCYHYYNLLLSSLLLLSSSLLLLSLLLLLLYVVISICFHHTSYIFVTYLFRFFDFLSNIPLDWIILKKKTNQTDGRTSSVVLHGETAGGNRKNNIP